MIDSLKTENIALKADLARKGNQLNEQTKAQSLLNDKQSVDEKKIAELENTVNAMLKAQASIK